MQNFKLFVCFLALAVLIFFVFCISHDGNSVIDSERNVKYKTTAMIKLPDGNVVTVEVSKIVCSRRDSTIEIVSSDGTVHCTSPENCYIVQKTTKVEKK